MSRQSIEEPLLRVSTSAKEGIYQGSRWLKFHVLCDEAELASFFAKVRPFSIFPLGGVVDGSPIVEEMFLDIWGQCIRQLSCGQVPKGEMLRKILACAWTENLDGLWLQKVDGKGYLTKICQPLVQVQAHWFSFSEIDGAFRPMSMGPESIFWGLQFAYPQIFQDPATMELKMVERSILFEKLRVWVRESTRATPFLVNGQKTTVPIRLGKNCFSWIGAHPQLKARGIQVEASGLSE